MPAELEAFDVLHDEHGRSRLQPEFEDPHDAAIGEEREGAGLAEECTHAGRQRGVRAEDFGRDDAVEAQVAKLEDFAHAAGADALDGVKPLEDRQTLRRQRARTLDGRIEVEVPRQGGVLGDQPAQRLNQLGTAVTERRGIERAAVQHVLLDVPLDQRLQFRRHRHVVTWRQGAGSVR